MTLMQMGNVESRSKKSMSVVIGEILFKRNSSLVHKRTGSAFILSYIFDADSMPGRKSDGEGLIRKSAPRQFAHGQCR